MCRRESSWILSVVVAVGAVAGCKQTELSDQPRSETLDPSSFFPDGQSARTPLAGTIPRDALRLDDHRYRGLQEGELASEFPFELERADLERGRERYDAFCAPCHGYVGEGDGMIVQRGFPMPSTLHEPRLREEPVGYIYQVITRGAVAMPSYRAQIPPDDRWRIVGYMRALQRSQFASRGDVPEDAWAMLMGGGDGAR